MKCYVCKKPINRAVRVFMPARNHREKDSFRNLCEECYTKEMERQGSKLVGNTWLRVDVCRINGG